MNSPSRPSGRLSYSDSGVDTAAATEGLKGLISWVGKTKDFREGLGESVVPIGFFASVLRLGQRSGLAISTDGVGSKSAVAQLVGSYEGIGWDCVAVNVNDVICTGAEPVALVDYISVQFPHPDLLESLGKGLHDGAERAKVSIVGGELSQHPDTLTGPREGYAFDISGTCVGLLDECDAITGAAVQPGDVVIGMPSNGIHANGLTLARRALLPDGASSAARHIDELGMTVGEELLRPTHIYIPEVMALLSAGINVHGLAHISGDGLLNLTRLEAPVSYRIDALPEIPPVFKLIQAAGNVETPEMFRVFNMGVGFCVVVPANQADAAIAAARGTGGEASVIGAAVDGLERRVEVLQHGLVGREGRFVE